MSAVIRALVVLASFALDVAATDASAQQSPLGIGVTGGLQGGIGSGLQSGLPSSLESGLGPPSARTLADPFNPYVRLQGEGGGCAPLQVDPDHRGCRPYEWLFDEGPDPNAIVSYYGDNAIRLRPRSPDPNRIETYFGDSAFRFNRGGGR
jgi:hypothetical protein